MTGFPVFAKKIAFVLGCVVSVATQAVAQAVAQPVQSALTGIVLPVGTRADRGMLTRMAAKFLLDDEAKKASAVIGKFEVFQLPLPQSSEVSTPIVEAIRGQGWEVTIVSTREPWGWTVKGDRRFMIYFTVDKKSASMFLAEAMSAPSVVAQSAVPAAPATTPAPGDRAPSIVAPPAEAPRTAPQPPSAPASESAAPSSPTRALGYAFTTTTFDDGWVATEEANWVRGARGDLTVRVHHAQYDLRRSTT